MSMGTRSWRMVSRSRMVTALSSRVSKSTVTQRGVPISSWRRYRLPMLWVSSYWTKPGIRPEPRTASRTLRAVGVRRAFLDSGRTATLTGAIFRMQLQQHSSLCTAGCGRGFLLGVGVDEEGHDRAVHTGGRLNHVRHDVLAAVLVEVGEALATGLRVRLQVVVGPVGDALNLAPAPGVEVFEIVGGLRVVGKLIGVVLPDADAVGRYSESGVPAYAVLYPLLVSFFVLSGHDEVLDLHGLELASSEDEVACGYLVSERLSNLGDAEREALTGGGVNVVEVDEDALGGLGTQVSL